LVVRALSPDDDVRVRVICIVMVYGDLL